MPSVDLNYFYVALHKNVQIFCMFIFITQLLKNLLIKYKQDKTINIQVKNIHFMC